jgi:hypothetical protein
MTTANAYLQLPINPNLFGVFCDVGAFYNGSIIQTAWNTGLGIRFSNVFGVYFPLFRSENMGVDLYKKYKEQIRFSLRLNIVNKGLKIGNLL